MVTKGEDNRLHAPESESEGEVDLGALSDPPDGIRTWDLVGKDPALVVRVMVDVTARREGDGGEVESRRGEVGRFREFLEELLGDPARFGDAECDPDVAWWRREGGAVAIALAFARLAAMAAATLVFFDATGVEGGSMGCAVGLGHAFSSCFLATASRPSKMARPRSCQMPSKTQNKTRADSLEAGFASARAFFKNFSRVSSIFDASTAFFERWP